MPEVRPFSRLCRNPNPATGHLSVRPSPRNETGLGRRPKPCKGDQSPRMKQRIEPNKASIGTREVSSQFPKTYLAMSGSWDCNFAWCSRRGVRLEGLTDDPGWIIRYRRWCSSEARLQHWYRTGRRIHASSTRAQAHHRQVRSTGPGPQLLCGMMRTVGSNEPQI